ncbi:ATP-dependent RNA helicase DDX54-like [Homarus americanus]|uniref:ATP-dependent RNA helicase DDX54-like n=1 Tax=Homarus americanus TaxID=6706 RepID=UPI001C477290|nr:ATP-dependent RNA helicase DDX54-like [Homarus americanus]
MAEDLEGWGATDAPMDGYASEGELDTRKLIAAKNRKKKKSGGFQSMGLSNPVFRGVMKKGYKVPTPIQRKTVPLILEGKDVVAMARTGSGKTACFLIPLFEKLQSHSAQTGARALILSPTRELALQTLKFTKELGRYTGLRAAVIVGGDSIEGQFAALHDNPDIIIAAPGRLVHICVEMNLKLQNVEYVVFDEADRLYEMGFAEQLTEIIRRLPEVRQTLLFSATLPKMLIEFARAGLTDPVLIRLDVEHVLSENLKMAFFKCNSDDKLALLFHILQHTISDRQQSVIFAATKHHVEYLHMALDMANIPNTYCYSALDPAARKINVAKFQTKKVRCLIVTDVAARGIDIPLLDNVINFNFPAKPKLFVHRVGRVARAGRSGVAFSFVAPDEAAYLLDLHLFLSKEIRFAPHPPDKSKKDDWSYMYGSVPQTLLDNEAEQIIHMHKTSTELTNMQNVISNAFKQYVKSRPAPSSESIKRMKESHWVCTVGVHPLLIADSMDIEERRLEMLHALKTLQPKGTVFEMIKTRKDANTQVIKNMKEKRGYDEKRIEAFHKNLQAKQTAKEEKEASSKQVTEKLNHLEQSTAEEVESTFSSIVGFGKKKKDNNQHNGTLELNRGLKRKASAESKDQVQSKKKKNKENQDFKDKQFYMSYSRDDQFAEQGYSLGTSFQKEANEAVLELTQDEDLKQRQNNSLHKWDRNKKRFVGTQDQQKKIKTESGVWIAASYKTNRYQKWIEKGKAAAEESSDEDEDSTAGITNKGRKGRKKFQTVNRKSQGKKHPLLKGKEGPKTKHPPRRELRTEDEIVKETKRIENERKKHMENMLKKRAKKGKNRKNRGGRNKKNSRK